MKKLLSVATVHQIGLTRGIVLTFTRQPIDLERFNCFSVFSGKIKRYRPPYRFHLFPNIDCSVKIVPKNQESLFFKSGLIINPHSHLEYLFISNLNNKKGIRSTIFVQSFENEYMYIYRPVIGDVYDLVKNLDEWVGDEALLLQLNYFFKTNNSHLWSAEKRKCAVLFKWYFESKEGLESCHKKNLVYCALESEEVGLLVSDNYSIVLDNFGNSFDLSTLNLDYVDDDEFIDIDVRMQQTIKMYQAEELSRLAHIFLEFFNCYISSFCNEEAVVAGKSFFENPLESYAAVLKELFLK